MPIKLLSLPRSSSEKTEASAKLMPKPTANMWLNHYSHLDQDKTKSISVTSHCAVSL